MNCDDFKFEYTVAPLELSEQACVHRDTCQECQAFIADQDAFELKLAKVVSCDVPKDFRHTLRENVVEKTASSISNVIQLGALWKMPQVSIALAASLIVSVILFNVMEPSVNTVIPVEQLVFEHMEHDSVRALKASHEYMRKELAGMERNFGVRVKDPGVLRFAQRCPMGDTYGLHMVYKNDDGEPFTVIYMPEVSLDKVQEFNFSGLKGWARPVTKGSLAIVGGTTLDLSAADAKVKKTLQWL